MILLFSALANFFTEVSVSLFMYLVNDLPKLVLMLLSLKYNPFVEAIAHNAINKTSHEGVRDAITFRMLVCC